MLKTTFRSMSWNIEGIRNSSFGLQHFIDLHSPSLICISEPQSYQCDISSTLQNISPSYSYHLNSEDLFDEYLPLVKSKAKGGTLLLWSSELDPYITILPTPTSAILPCRVSLPGLIISYHICIYLPTAGKDDQFVSELAALEVMITDIYEKHDGLCPVFIRGDGNASSKNVFRSTLLQHFLSKHNIHRVQIPHLTYHHFVGDGLFDSDLDVVLYTNTPGCREVYCSVVCKVQNPLVDSLHDIVFSEFTLPPAPPPPPPSLANITAPKVPNTRQKILWSQEGISKYEAAVSSELARLESTWGESAASSPSSMASLLSSTYSLLCTAAAATNRAINLGIPRTPQPRRSPHIKKLQLKLLAANRFLSRSKNPASAVSCAAAVSAAATAVSLARAELKQAVRAQQRQDSFDRDRKLNSIISGNCSGVFKSIKSAKTSSSKIQTIRVGSQTYHGANVPDGFYDSLSRLKCPDMSVIETTPQFMSTLADYDNIIKFCKTRQPIPAISPEQSCEILKSVRSDVNDFYSITANHFLHAGPAGINHFHFLLSTIINNVNLVGLDELNTAWSCILYKGHSKDKESDRSYQNISTCPFIAKCADLYVGKLNNLGWLSCQAETQFQGESFSHELAAVLFTETIQYSLFVN